VRGELAHQVLVQPALYLAGEGSRYMTGALLTIDGGYTLW